MAIKLGVESTECVLYRMFDAIRHDSKVIGREITEMVGGPNVSVCDAGRVVNNPEARAYADEQRAALEERVRVVAHGYMTGPVSDEESRQAAGGLLRALPYMFTSFYHPGMTNNSNGVERTIRQTTSGRAPYSAYCPTGKRPGTRPYCATCTPRARQTGGRPGRYCRTGATRTRSRRRYRRPYSTRTGAAPVHIRTRPTATRLQ